MSTTNTTQTDGWFRLIVEGAPSAMIIVDRERLITLVNPETEKLFGYSRQELVGQPIELLVPERFRGQHPERVRDFVLQPSARPMGAGRELFGRHKDGSEVPIEIALTPLEAPDGVYTLASIVDITERKLAEERFRLVFEAAPNAMLMVARDGKIALVNRKLEDLFGYERSELVGRPVEVLVPERYRSHHPKKVLDFFVAQEARAMGQGRDLYGRRKSGQEVPIEVGLSPINTSEGLFTLASIVDITARRRAQERFRRVVEASPNAILAVDRDGRIALVNRKLEELFGHSRERLMGQPMEILVPERFRARHADHFRGFFANPEARAMGAGRELFGLRQDGTEMPIEIGLSPFETEEGMLTLASIIDITERRRSEDALRRSNEALEQFAYVASHDLQEPLRMVASYTELLAQRYRGRLDERADKYIHYAVDGAKRMQRLVSDLLKYSRIAAAGKPLEPVASHGVMKGVMELLEGTIQQAGATIDVEGLPMVRADEGQLSHLFQNLIGNALKFRGEAPPCIRVRAEPAHDFWLFSVADNGIGIPPQYADRIFQMFQRLHERGKYEGSGIGLAIAKRIVERHGGRIWFESQEGNGTTFFFTLPAVMAKGSLP